MGQKEIDENALYTVEELKQKMYHHIDQEVDKMSIRMKQKRKNNIFVV